MYDYAGHMSAAATTADSASAMTAGGGSAATTAGGGPATAGGAAATAVTGDDATAAVADDAAAAATDGAPRGAIATEPPGQPAHWPAQNSKTAQKLGFAGKRRVDEGDRSFAMDAKQLETAMGKPLRRGGTAYQETECLGDNWAVMTDETSNGLALPNAQFVEALDLKPNRVASPDTPFPIPPENEGCSARASLRSFAGLHGGHDPEKMKQQVTVGDLFVYLLEVDERLRVPAPVEVDDAARAIHSEVMRETRQAMPAYPKNAYQLFLAGASKARRMISTMCPSAAGVFTK